MLNSSLQIMTEIWLKNSYNIEDVTYLFSPLVIVILECQINCKELFKIYKWID